MERTHSCALLEATLRDQLGVISRRQVLESGLDDNFIECRLRRKDWARVHRGVYVTHTGPLTWLQRAWAAVLVYWPAALAGRSALVAFGVSPAGGRGGAIAQGSGSALRQLSSSTGPEARIEVAVDQTRRVGQVDGVDVHRVVNLAAALHPSRRPPVLRLERALLDVASAARDEATAVAVLADACQAGRTTARRLLDVLRPRIRLPGRALLLEVLEDVVAGAYSVLEHRYLNRVERPHGLPTAKRQRRVRRGRSAAFRDVEYLGFRTVVELDGRIGHELSLDRWDDLERDVEAATGGDITVRLGYGHVLDPCRCAWFVGRLLRARGWSGAVRRCGPSCTAPDRSVPGDAGGLPAPDAGDAPTSAA
jgi:hypothetical protein